MEKTMDFSRLKRPEGFTLVELMIVVAIVGVLAAVAGVAYVKYTKSAKITQLKQYAMDVAAGQEQYKSRNSAYLDAGDYASNGTKYEKLLGFNATLEPDTTIETKAGTGQSGDTCDAFCEGSAPPSGQIYYAVKVTRDLDDDETEDTIVLYHNGLKQPVVLNEFK
jgi:prepilin-type N-terminal cleavage/methylation domain-containing protein